MTASDSPALAKAAAPQQQKLLYFAYGSMCNPVSLNRRGMYPTASCPAQLQGYRLAFQLGACHRAPCQLPGVPWKRLLDT